MEAQIFQKFRTEKASYGVGGVTSPHENGLRCVVYINICVGNMFA